MFKQTDQLPSEPTVSACAIILNGHGATIHLLITMLSASWLTFATLVSVYPTGESLLYRLIGWLILGLVPSLLALLAARLFRLLFAGLSAAYDPTERFVHICWRRVREACGGSTLARRFPAAIDALRQIGGRVIRRSA